MAFVHLGRESPLVQFPGMPCSPEALLSALDVHPEVAKRDIVAIQTANGCIETRFALRRRDRSYQHSQNWKSMVAALEKELQTFISEHRIHEGVVVIHDLIDTDEEFEGLGLFENGKACYSLSGELLRSRSVTNPASCILRAQPEQAQNTDHLAKLLTAPLLWRVHSVNGKSVLARESSQWNRKGSVTTHRSSTL